MLHNVHPNCLRFASQLNPGSWPTLVEALQALNSLVDPGAVIRLWQLWLCCDYAVTFPSLCLDPTDRHWRLESIDMIISYHIISMLSNHIMYEMMHAKENTAIKSSLLVCRRVHLAPMSTRTSRYEPHFASRVILVTSWMSQPETTSVQYATWCDMRWPMGQACLSAMETVEYLCLPWCLPWCLHVVWLCS